MEDDIMKMLNEASSATQEESDEFWTEEDPVSKPVENKSSLLSKEYTEDYSMDTSLEEDDSDIDVNADKFEDLSDEDLLNKMRDQSKRYEREIKKMQKSREIYENASKEIRSNADKRGFFELNLNKSNLKGNTILERLGYDKTAKNDPKYHRVEGFIDSKITTPKARNIFYGVISIICVIAVLLHHIL